MYFWAAKRILDSRGDWTYFFILSELSFLAFVLSSFLIFSERAGGGLHCGPGVPGACGQDDLNFLYVILRIAFLT